MHLIRSGCVGLLVLWSGILRGQVTFKVLDEAGAPVNQFEAMYHTAGEGWSPWERGTDGNGRLPLYSPKSRVISVLVRSDEFASAPITFQGEKLQELLRGDATITLAKGREVKLQLLLPEGMEFPEGFIPQLYFPDYESTVRMMWQTENLQHGVPDFNMLNVKKVSDGRYRFRLSSDPMPFRVAIHHPGWLRFCELGQQSNNGFEDNQLQLQVPQPATVEARLSLKEEDGEKLPFESVAYHLMWRVPGTSNSYLSVDSTKHPLSTSFVANDLGPGTYLLKAFTEPKEKAPDPRNGEIHPGRFFDMRYFIPGRHRKQQITFEYIPFNSDAFRGDGTARIRVLSADGVPVSGREVKVSFYDGHYGMLTVYEGSIPEGGNLNLEGISTQLTSYDSPYGPYVVEVDGESLGYFRFDAGQSDIDVKLHLTPKQGDRAPDIELTQIESNKKSRLSNYRGKIVLLELWATWCGPCQPAMDKLREIVTANRDRWGDEVVVAPLSVDETLDRLSRHVRQRGWADLDHYWSAREKSEPISPVELAFVVHAVPTAILIDRDGRIVWRGHPTDETDGYSMADRVQRLLEDRDVRE